LKQRRNKKIKRKRGNKDKKDAYMEFIARRSKYVVNPLEEDDAIAEKLRKKGKEVIELNRGDPSVYFKTPKYIIEAYVSALKESKTHYVASAGVYELRNALQKDTSACII